MIEDDKLIVEDLEIISELSTFIVKGSSFEADDGCTDDLVACMFIFAWATDQTYFKELTDMDIRGTMMREQQDALEQDMAPFGFVVTGLEDENIGEQDATAMQNELEYDNLIMSSMRGRAGQVLGGGFSGGRAQLGVRTTKTVKKVGCSNLKQLIEDDKLIIEDLDIISELSTFIVKGKSFEADDGCTDDLVACLFLFAWTCDQTYFKELTDMDIRQTMMKEQQDALEQDMAPFGFVVTGLEDENIGEVIDEYGTRWNPVVRDYGSDW